MAIKPKLYLETTIPSYLVSKPSRDLRLAADQEQTLEWREEHRSRFEIFIPFGSNTPKLASAFHRMVNSYS